MGFSTANGDMISIASPDILSLHLNPRELPQETASIRSRDSRPNEPSTPSWNIQPEC